MFLHFYIFKFLYFYNIGFFLYQFFIVSFQHISTLTVQRILAFLDCIYSYGQQIPQKFATWLMGEHFNTYRVNFAQYTG